MLPGTLPQPPTALVQAEAMAAYTRSLLEPMVAHVAELEGTIRTQAEVLGQLRERLATAEARLRAQNAAVDAPTSTQATETTNGVAIRDVVATVARGGLRVNDVRRPPPDRQCRATVAGQLNRGAYWVPPRRCGHYARENGYCGHHQPAIHRQTTARRLLDGGGRVGIGDHGLRRCSWIQ